MSRRSDGWAVGERVRSLGASEYLLHLLEEKASASHLVRVIEFDGPVDPALMERAFRQMVARRPILGVRLPAAEAGERPVFVFDDSRAPSFTVRERHGPDDWLGAFNEELNLRIGVDGAPTIRALLLTGDEPGGELLVTCLHTVCDGRSLFWFCRHLLAEYEALQRREAGDPSLATSGISPAVEELLPEWATPERGEQLVADALKRTSHLPTPMPWPSQRGDSTEPIATHALPMDLSIDELSAVRANAHANGTTVLGALGAALVLATDDVLQPAPDDAIVISNTLDIRDRLRVPVPVEDMGVYATVLHSRHSNVGKMSEWDHARDHKTQVTEGMDRYDHYTFVFIGERFVESFTGAGGDPLFTGALANLGAMELPSEGTSLRPRLIRGGLNIHASAWPFISINGMGINGRLAMSVTYQHPEITDERAGEFAAAMSERMRWFAKVER